MRIGYGSFKRKKNRFFFSFCKQLERFICETYETFWIVTPLETYKFAVH